ncbi:MAG: hypothetical protein ABI634_12885 [Acidobacteriota bacterium]
MTSNAFPYVFSRIVSGMCLGVAIGFALLGDRASALLFIGTACFVHVLIAEFARWAERQAPAKPGVTPVHRVQREFTRGSAPEVA